ncbi:hypothetical protein EI94DRAFT_1723821 [Lactarius quietus]|nr:hypothetical protein EI94DRAFT_1723821 [Lactarius quietus]
MPGCFKVPTTLIRDISFIGDRLTILMVGQSNLRIEELKLSQTFYEQQIAKLKYHARRQSTLLVQLVGRFDWCAKDIHLLY